MNTNTQRNNSKYRLKLIERATPQELIFKKFLESKKIRFIFQKGFLKPFHRICDFYLPKYRLIVEIDGGYHKDTKQKDDRKDFIWRRFKTLRILNSQVDNGEYKDIFTQMIGH